MRFLKRFLILLVLLAGLLLPIHALVQWAQTPLLISSATTVDFRVAEGSSVRSASRQMVAAGVPVNPILFELLFRLYGMNGTIKAGPYELDRQDTPLRLIEKLVRGEFSLTSITIIEGWTFKRMRQYIDAHPALKHETAGMSEAALLRAIAQSESSAEGRFFPDTYQVPKGSSDTLVYQKAFQAMQHKLSALWDARASGLPLSDPYQALILASIIEKETGKAEDRALISRVFINRLRKGMPLQTDPSVIYGMGGAYQGNIRKRDLNADTPYNTYTRNGLPPTPIALPGAAALFAALHPAESRALYFVARGDGSSQFSETLEEHNRAVNQYQR